MSTISPTGRASCTPRSTRPQFLGELGVFGEHPRTADLLTLEDSEVWRVDGERFVGFVTAEPAAARQVLAALARQVQEHQAFADDLLFLDLRGRVAKRLLQMGTPSLEDLPAGRDRRSRRSPTPTSRACAVAAGRTSAASCPISSGAGSSNATATGTS